MTLPQGGSLQIQLGFPARGVSVFNGGGNWVRLPDVNVNVPPYSTLALTIPSTQVAKADTTPPPGQSNQPTGQPAVITWTDTPQAAASSSLTTALAQQTGLAISQAYNAYLPGLANLATTVISVATNSSGGGLLPAGTYDIGLVDIYVAAPGTVTQAILNILMGPHPFNPGNFFAAYQAEIVTNGPVQKATFQPTNGFQPRVTLAQAAGIDIQFTNMGTAFGANAVYVTVTTAIRLATF